MTAAWNLGVPLGLAWAVAVARLGARHRSPGKVRALVVVAKIAATP